MWRPELAPEATYHEMGLVPCVEVVKEARACSERGSGEIFDMIVGERTRFPVMDDYARTVHEPRPGAVLNSDTKVRAGSITAASCGTRRYSSSTRRRASATCSATPSGTGSWRWKSRKYRNPTATLTDQFTVCTYHTATASISVEFNGRINPNFRL
jgi:hypothetical protein